MDQKSNNSGIIYLQITIEEKQREESVKSSGSGSSEVYISGSIIIQCHSLTYT